MGHSSRSRDVSLAALLLFALAVSPASAQPPAGYPCTMYKAEDIARARQNIARHEWARKWYQGIIQGSTACLQMDDATLRSYISEQTPILSVKCPTCGNGPWYWYDILPQVSGIRCKSCSSEFLWDPDDTTEDFSVQGVIRYERLHSVTGPAYGLGLRYQIDGDVEAARKAAVLIERMAEVFKGYRMNRVNRNEWMDTNDAYYGRIGGWKYREAGELCGIIHAYDLIHDSGVFTPQQHAMIERDLIAHVRDYFLHSYGDAGLLGNQTLQDQGHAWWCLAACAAILGDTDTLQLMVETFEQMLGPDSWVFYEDGTFYEGTYAYQGQFIGGIWPIPEILRGNLDVDIYSNPRCALWEKVLTWYLDGIFPDGTLPAIADAHVGYRPVVDWSEIAYTRYGNRKALRHLRDTWGDISATGGEFAVFYRDPDMGSVADEGEPYGLEITHLTGMGLMILRDEAGPKPTTMAFLDYGPLLPRNHKQKDYGNFGLWACGLEMVSEIGYAHQPAWVNRWQGTPIAHNTVIELASQEQKGEPMLWCINGRCRMAEAGLPGSNSRFIAMLLRPEGAPVIVDIFRVSGPAEVSTWALHARSSDWTVTGIDDLQPVQVEEPLRNGRQGVAAGDISATWTFATENHAVLRAMMLADSPAEVTLSECPPEEDEVLKAHVSGGNPRPGVEMPYRGHIQIKRPNPAVFVTVYAPGDDAHPSDVVAELVPVDRRPDAVGVDLQCADGTRFVLLHAPEPGPVSCRGLTVDGRAGAVCLVNGAARWLSLAGGGKASYGAMSVVAAEGSNALMELGAQQ